MNGSYLVLKTVAVEVYCVQVYFIAHSHQIPVDFISHMHCEALEVPIHSSINSVHFIAFYEFIIVFVYFLRVFRVCFDVVI